MKYAVKVFWGASWFYEARGGVRRSGAGTQRATEAKIFDTRKQAERIAARYDDISRRTGNDSIGAVILAVASPKDWEG